ncbi:hypothetical protein HDU91_005008 [Kappamyces sp. JEL0680]|nr:hypothetical protein HDU91_005008 [Kappamyces sp. JEL0680]
MKIETLIVTLLPLAAAQSLQCNVVTSTILSTVTVSVSPTTATPVPSSVPIRVSSFNVSASQLSVVAAVQNIAYTKAITVPFCDQSSVCSGSFPCSYASKLNDTYETWTCSSSAFPNGATSFSLKYVVSGNTYPVSYKLQSRQGSLKELRAMITACRKFGVRVYADAVVNHMTGNGNAANNKRNQNGGTCSYWDHHNSTAQSPYYTHGYTYKLDPSTGQRPALEYPAVPYGPSDFHCERSLDSYTSGFVMQYGWLSGLADLHTGKDSVRERIATYMATLLSVGFSGFRVDAAKHISPDDLAAIFGKLAKKMGGSLPPEFITYLEVLIGGEKDLLCCTYSNYDYYQYFTDVLGAAGLSQTDIAKIKIWSSDYPKEFPVCGRRILPDERFVIQNDDHDQQNSGSSSRDMQGFGSVLIKDKDINAHRGFEVQLFARTDGSWAIRQVLSGWYFNAGSNAVGWPDGKSDCSLYSGNQSVTCGNVPYHKAYVANACGYSMLVNGNWEVGAYTRVHRDTSIINAMRKWMGLASTNQAALGIPSSCP